jgi:uncharacterized membrane protein
MTERRARSLAKSVSYRTISWVITGSIFFGATQKPRLALAVALVDSLVKMIAFYLHERAWTRIGFGRPQHTRLEVERIQLADLPGPEAAM